MTNQCATCHSGAYPPADGKPANHIPYQTLSGVAIANCDSCHKCGLRGLGAGASFHSNVSVSTQCASCHTGSYPPAVGQAQQRHPRRRDGQLRELPQVHRQLGQR